VSDLIAKHPVMSLTLPWLLVYIRDTLSHEPCPPDQHVYPQLSVLPSHN